MSAIPPAPPLPPSRAPAASQPSSGSAFARITRSLTSSASRPTQHTRADVGKSVPAYPPKLHGLSPQPSQSCSLMARGESEFSSIDINRDRTHAIVAGKDCLKTIRIDGDSCEVESDIHQTIITHDRHSGTRNRDTLDIHDVKWSHGEFSTYIATAASSGKIVIYDLGKPGLEIARLHEHTRQVHKVAFNPHGGQLLLSGSQDGYAYLWDVRDARPNVREFRCKRRYNGQSESIRDIKWNPQDAYEFAIGTDLGVVQKWDCRNPQKPVLKISSAHDNACSAIDWHPDGKHLLSAGIDKYLRVWDLSSDNKRPRGQWPVRTPYPIKNACWRYNDQDVGSASSPCTQVATSYHGRYPVIHVWDLKRPAMPGYEVSDWSTAPEDMVWASHRLLWTVTKDGQFNQIDLNHVPRRLDRRPMQAFAMSPTGEICVFSQKRPRRRPSDVDIPRSPFASSEPSDPFSEKAELNRSFNDEAIDDNMLSSSYKRQHARALSTRSNKSAASTPPSVVDPGPRKVPNLSETMSRREHPASKSQVAFRGILDGTTNATNFSYLAQKYKTDAFSSTPTIGSYLNVGRVFDQNALYAQKTGSYRMAQTWRMFSAILSHELQHRARENKRQRLLQASKHQQPVIKSPSRDLKSKLSLFQTPLSLQNPAVRAIQAGTVTPLGIESTSNVTTPQARPIHHQMHVQGASHLSSTLPNPEHDLISLPPAVNKPPAASTAAPPRQDTGSPRCSVPVFDDDEPEWFLSSSQINARKAQMHNWRATPKMPLDFDLPPNSPMAIAAAPPRVMRHNSDDSFGMLSMSTDSQHEGAASSFSASLASVSARVHRPSMSRIPESHGAIDFASPTRPTFPTLQHSSSSMSDFSRGTASWITSSSEFDSEGKSLENGRRGQSTIENSQTIIPDDNYAKPIGTEYGSLISADPNIILSDFAAPIHRSPIGGINATAALLQVFSYYSAQVPNAQIIYHLALVLATILNTTKPKQQSKNHVSLSSFLGLPIGQVESILATYHDQLQSLQIYNPAVILSRASVRSHPDLFDTSNRQIGFVCLDCDKPINNPGHKTRCENCSKRQSPCPICWQKYPALAVRKPPRKHRGLTDQWAQNTSSAGLPDVSPSKQSNSSPSKLSTNGQVHSDEPKVSQSNHAVLWQSCLTCGHGAHAACMQSLQHDPRLGGKCPTEGCLCDCIAGSYRSKLNREAMAEAEERSIARRHVKRDEVRVRESAAAKGARGILEATGSARSEEKRVVFVD